MTDPPSFYDDFAEYYHLIFDDWEASRKRQARALDRLISTLHGSEVVTVLDCACGIGTQALGLAELGYQVTATDLSSKAVEQARKTALSMGLNLKFGVADFRTLGKQVPGEFNIVLASGNSLAHLIIEEEMIMAARELFTKTNPGGHLIISLRDYDEILKSPPRVTPVRVFDSPEGRRVYFQIWDWVPGKEEYRFQLFLIKMNAEGEHQTRVYHSHLRAWRRDLLTHLFKDAGYDDVLWRMPSETGHHSPIMTARRPSP